MSGQTASPILQQANFTKDYRNIKPLQQLNGSIESLPSSDDLNWVESGFSTKRNAHSTSSLERYSTNEQQPETTPTIPMGYQIVPSKEGVSSSKGDSTPSLVPLRGNDYATVRPDNETTIASGRVIHPERKRVTISTPPADVHNYNTWVCVTLHVINTATIIIVMIYVGRFSFRFQLTLLQTTKHTYMYTQLTHV